MKNALVLEDLPESQEMLCELLQTAFAGITVHAEASVAAALECVSRKPLDLALIDLALPDGSGVTVIQALAERYPDCMIVVATIYEDDAHLFPALRAGAQGYLLKDETLERLVAQLQGIVKGQPPLSPAVARRLLKHFREPVATLAPVEDSTQQAALTAREREVLQELSRGVTLATIAENLGISRHTVGDHVKNIYRKLNISSRAQAALHAHNLGLMSGK
ncbi:response regulator [Rhodoferax sp. GW822-FHT02A01]|jgi:DNA-binding NarL/FixJ family response regulator|uniref:response regulator n=1 Tax=Rhodoferax sp. GW822-FHT02A01 TaxID=3141537 RepID=UPI00315D9ACB